ncbi:tyrosine-protein kinase domain-containing protein [Myxosarcina sp. GI1]|uniref:GumC family protein n=1 Tax=Myxosarcina sp. GI1 TaxID=1541065 RepID=UPI00055C3E0E|nr:tyrosine-protein kinase domain-containing protein [Myxosarcina sp. GI1]
MEQNLETQKLYYFNDSLTSEKIEGGLNLNDIKDAIFRKLPIIAGCTITMACFGFYKIATTPPSYVASFELLSEPLNIETQVTSTDEQSRETREEITSVELDEVQLKILKSPKLISRVTKSLKDKYPDLNYQNLISSLSIDIITGDSSEQNILQVVYENPNKFKVSDVIDVLTQTYLDYSLEKRKEVVQRGISFLDSQIPKISAEIYDLEDQIRTLRIKYNFFNPEVSLEQITTRLNTGLGRESEQNTIELNELQLLSEKLERELKIQPAKSTIALQLATPQYESLLDRLRQLDVEISRKSAIYSDKSTQLQTLKRERRELIALITDEGEIIRQKLDNQIETLNKRQQNIKTETANLKLQIEEWSTISSEYNNLKQRLALANKKRNEFILQKDALLIDAAQREAPWQLLTPASEPQTKNISAVNYLLLSSVLGTLIGVGVGLTLDRYQKIVYTSAKVEEITNLPILAKIPYSYDSKSSFFGELLNFRTTARQLPQPSSQLQIREFSISKLASPSVEAFRSFAANLGLLNFSSNSKILDLDSRIESLVVTSAISGEGKSTVALNLARASASMGKRVVLVDTDLRNSDCLTKRLGWESEIGLMNFLNREEPELDLLYCLKQMPTEENLFVLTSGFESLDSESNEIDSSRLLASVQMYQLMKKLKTNFDLVIYDLCSIIGFADVNLLAGKSDGIIVVTGLGKINTATLTEALNHLKRSQLTVLGLAINDVANKS